MTDNVETMAYAGSVPWHGLGVKVSPNLTPAEILKEAQLDWEVKKQPLYTAAETSLSGQRLDSHHALVRSSDDSILGICGNRFQPTQNSEAFEFFTRFIKAGEMEMHTAGSLDKGRNVWALAKVSEGFELPGGDKVESFMLLSNPHVWGESLKVMFTPIRVVCQNTLTAAVGGFNTDSAFRMMHTKTFNNEEIFKQAEKALGLVKTQLEEHEAQARFLSSVEVPDDNAYFNYFMDTLYQNKDTANDNLNYAELPLKVKNLLDLVRSQPGAEIQSSKNTYWGAYNAVTYWADHEAGRTNDSRLNSAWFGQNALVKRRALATAVTHAKVAA